LFATHCRLDQWNIPYEALKEEANRPAFFFFNRYAGLHDPADSPRAFCALRDGLDASDFHRFPASEFGGTPGRKREVGRYMNIAGAYAKYGARMDDPEKATGGGMINRKRMGYNDAGWGILPGNYCRFLEQVDPDTVPHVIERLDAWARAFRGVEHKVFMGGVSQHGLGHGFGIRRGFVEMYLYHIPDETIGQTVDENGYLWVDDSADVLKRNIFHGEENEEYEEKWASEEREFRFGLTTESYPYRYFTSNLRLLQMRCNYVLYNPFSLWPEQMVWVGQNLGRTVDDAPDIWCALRESYVRRVGPVKNFERWLYQRDSEGFETEPAVPVDVRRPRQSRQAYSFFNAAKLWVKVFGWHALKTRPSTNLFPM
jgi:hypothetical protein